MDAILQSTARLVRALIFITCTVAIVYFVTIRIFKAVNNSSDISIETNEKGGFIFKVSKKEGASANEQYAQFLLPSNACWYNTGLDVKEDEECLVRVTGNVHLAFNKLYRDVDNDKIPIIKWTGPEGNEWANIKDGSACAKAKRSLLIKPGNTIGNVVGYLNNEDKTDKDFIGYFLKNRQRITLDVEDVNRQKIMKTEKKGTSTLYLCVNDILLDLTSPEQTQLSKDAFEGRDKNVSEWNSLEQQPEYYRLWFDDNIGGFLVSVTIRKKS